MYIIVFAYLCYFDVSIDQLKSKTIHLMNEPAFIKYDYTMPSESELAHNIQLFYQKMITRRSVRFFSDKKIPPEVINQIILTASSAPSGAHKQPWTFCIISDPEIKNQIRQAAEKEEFDNYHGRMSAEWLKELEKFDTNWQKPFLTEAPYLIVVFKKAYDESDGLKSKNYYVSESVGIAAGFLIAAIHMAGLVTLTHTPSPMNFLQIILKRPENERPFLLLPVGYAKEGVQVPNLHRKSLDQVAVYY